MYTRMNFSSKLKQRKLPCLDMASYQLLHQYITLWDSLCHLSSQERSYCSTCVAVVSDGMIPYHQKKEVHRQKWTVDFHNIASVCIPHCLMPSNVKNAKSMQLHHFSDASNIDNGQCAYLRLVGEEQVHCIFIAAKARVAPAKVT